MSEEVKPALTAEEWRDVIVRRNYLGAGGGTGASHVCQPTGSRGVLIVTDTGRGQHHATIPLQMRHGIAALCLHGQPFGFTRDDVEYLDSIWGFLISKGDAPDELCSIRDRIAALLPPEEK